MVVSSPGASTYLGSVTSYSPEEVSTSDAGTLNIFVAGIPCTGASLVGRSKNHLSAAEVHKNVGHLFLPSCHCITRHMPHVVVFESVKQYATTFSANVIRRHLAMLGCAIAERIINPFGCEYLCVGLPVSPSIYPTYDHPTFWTHEPADTGLFLWRNALSAQVAGCAVE